MSDSRINPFEGFPILDAIRLRSDLVGLLSVLRSPPGDQTEAEREEIAGAIAGTIDLLIVARVTGLLMALGLIPEAD